jgi:hypothetical protein
MTMRNPAFGDDSDADFGRNPIQRGDLPRCRLSGCCSQSSRHGAPWVRAASAYTAGFGATSAFDGGGFGESKLSLIVSGQYASISASSAVCVSTLFPMNSV